MPAQLRLCCHAMVGGEQPQRRCLFAHLFDVEGLVMPIAEICDAGWRMDADRRWHCPTHAAALTTDLDAREP